MEETVFGVILTIIMPFAVLIIATAVRKLGVSGEGARKLVHFAEQLDFIGACSLP